MKKVGILTFHAVHNYGANLQAYALQQVVNKLGGGDVQCEIINFRTDRQKKATTLFVRPKSFSAITKDLFVIANYRNIKARQRGFERFVSNYMTQSKIAFANISELQGCEYDYYISGSDQIWNWNLRDFDMAYFLPFVKSGKRVAYAPSFGDAVNSMPVGQIKDCILKYDNLSIREPEGQRLIQALTGRTSPVLVDPTLLLGRQAWDDIAPERLVKKGYIFLYNFFPNKEKLEIVKKIQKATGLPVIVPRMAREYLFRNITTVTNTATLEFLSLVKYANFVVTTSFHGVAFSILFQKPFLSINGLEDSRISNLLRICGLTDRAANLENINEKLNYLWDVDYNTAKNAICIEREKSIAFLKKALEL